MTTLLVRRWVILNAQLVNPRRRKSRLDIDGGRMAVRTACFDEGEK
jgi:hypothetical protein